MSFGLGQINLIVAESSPVWGGGITVFAVGATSLYRLRRWERRHFLNPAPNLSLKYGFLIIHILEVLEPLSLELP